MKKYQFIVNADQQLNDNQEISWPTQLIYELSPDAAVALGVSLIQQAQLTSLTGANPKVHLFGNMLDAEEVEDLWFSQSKQAE